MKNVRDYNVGKSDYAKHTIQPWDIILEYGLNYWDGDIIKRVLRTKEGEARRLEYEKIIHICKERIRQIDMNEPCYQGEQEDKDETTVFCPSEKERPSYSADGHVFKVYSLFESGRHLYAYAGYSEINKAHVYIGLTTKEFCTCTLNDFPLPVILLSEPVGFIEHAASLKIGKTGTLYVKNDYIINRGKLYRFMGLTEDGEFFKYAKFMGCGVIDYIKVTTKIRNYAEQVTCEK